MVTVPRGVPAPETIQERKPNQAVGKLQKLLHDAKPPEKGVTRLPPTTPILKNKKAGRYRYERGVKNPWTGKLVGGKFCPDPAKETRGYKLGFRTRESYIK